MENNNSSSTENNLELENKAIELVPIKTKPKLVDNIYIQYNIYKNYIIIVCIILVIYFLFKYNIITLSFTSLNIYNNNINKDQFNNKESNKLITNENEWNLENEIEKLIKNQNIYIQEKKL